ncbi:MAG: DNA gyrase C-terminal beta-propeller domain-containing protein, partial [Clostridia bacterium]
AKGTNVINLLPIESDEKISAMIPVREFDENSYLFFGTKNGVVKKTSLIEYNSARRGGLNAIVLDDDDELVRVKLTNGTSDIILGTHDGIAIKFNETDVRAQGRTTRGVRGIRLNEGDYVIGVAKADTDTTLLTVTENGFGKRTNVSEYRIQTRGGKGILNYNISEKTGNVVGMKVVTDDDDIMIISSDGVIIRIKACDISVIGRNTSGVKIMRLSPDIKLVTIAKTARDEEDDEEEISEDNIEVEVSSEEEIDG